MVESRALNLGKLEMRQPMRVPPPLEAWNATGRAFPLDTPAHVLFERQAARDPGRVAVVFGATTLTYGALDAEADRWARRLREAGVGPEVLVGLWADRSHLLVIAILAVWKAGGAYVPLDPKHPANRQRRVLEGARCPLLLVADAYRADYEAVASNLEPDQRPRALPLEAGFGDGMPTGSLPWSGHRGSLAYVIFTSGSTGLPKGAMVEQQGMVNHLLAKVEDLAIGPEDGVVQNASQCFDISVWQMWSALMVGGRVHVLDDDTALDPRRLAAAVREGHDSVLEVVPSMLQVLLDVGASVGYLDALRWMISTGEALVPALCRRWLAQHPDIPLLNAYGPTECSDDVTHHVIRTPPPPQTLHMPVGRPIANTRLYVLRATEEGFELCSPGEPGELCVTGVCVGRGYLNDPERTARAFYEDPFSAEAGARLYRTGDLARFLDDGAVEFLGRIDHQVKVRGFRIELAEIESVLTRHPGVKEAVVSAPQDDRGTRFLAAYVVGGALAAELRAFLLDHLPEYMVPASFTTLDALPLTPNGKVDRDALPAPSAIAADRPWVAPETPLQEAVAEAWAAALGLERVSLDDDFFALGGDSIRAVLAVNRLQARLGAWLYVTALFEAPSVRAFSASLAHDYAVEVERAFGVGAGTPGAEGPADAQAEAALRRIIANEADTRPASPVGGAVLFVLCPPRSGSTLLRVMLGRHPGVFAPSELELASFHDLASRDAALQGPHAFWKEGLARALMELDGLDADQALARIEGWRADGATTGEVYRLLITRLQGRVLVDKTTTYALDPAALERTRQLFPEARYVEITRHPRAMVQSFHEVRLDQVFLRHPHELGPRQLGELLWRVAHANIAAFFASIPANRRLTLRLEDLVTDPEGAARGLAALLGLPFDPAMLDPYGAGRAGMTDGIRPQSRMLGDPRFHEHQGIDARVAEAWRELGGALDPGTVRAAAALGYAAGPIPPAPAGEDHPVTPMQVSFLLLDAVGRGASYNCRAAYDVEGPLPPERLAAAFRALVARHEALRTTFRWVDGEPRQVIGDGRAFELVHQDLRAAPQEVDRLLEQLAERPFDLSADLPLRAALLTVGADRHVLAVVVPHVLTDGWSLRVMLRDLLTLLSGATPPPLPLQYKDFAAWYLRELDGDATRAHRDYWYAQLGDPPAPLDLPTDHPRPELKSSRGDNLYLDIDDVELEPLRTLAASEGATMFMAILAVIKTMLYRYTGEEDVTVGTPVAGRSWRELEDVLGLFMNVLVLRDRVRGDLSFRDLLRSVRATTLGAWQHQRYPFDHLVHELDVPIDLSRGQIFDVLVAFHNNKEIIDLERAAGGLALRPRPLTAPTSRFDLSFDIEASERGLSVRIEYDADLFEPERIRAIAADLRGVLRAAGGSPERRVADLLPHPQNEVER